MKNLSAGLIALLLSFSSTALTLDKTEVSNAEYKSYMDSTKDTETPRYFTDYRSDFFKKSEAANVANFDEKTFSRPDHPVVGVSWYAAKSYCAWAGGSLPTRDEWLALSGSEGNIWAWGDTWDYSKANTGGEFKNENDGYIYSAPVTSFLNGASPKGQLNISGNVAEWTLDQFVVGGSSKSTPSGASINAYTLYEPEFRSFDIGFRCVK